jgi:hypothetical protein
MLSGLGPAKLGFELCVAGGTDRNEIRRIESAVWSQADRLRMVNLFDRCYSSLIQAWLTQRVGALVSRRDLLPEAAVSARCTTTAKLLVLLAVPGLVQWTAPTVHQRWAT